MKQGVGLVVEPSSERAALMYQRWPKEWVNNLIWCKTVEEAIDVLSNYKAELFLVSLAHDLNGILYQDVRSPDSGMEIVRWLEKQDPKEYENCLFVIHSHNNEAGPRMWKRLVEKGYNTTYNPFGY